MTAAPISDPLGEQLVAAGFAPNLLLLDMNHSLAVPSGFALPSPWNLPSRLFQFPIEVCKPDGDQPRRLGLRHPGLASHPFVKHVESVLGLQIERDGAPNRYGYSSCRNAQWWHAVDLVSAGKWRELLDTATFTEPGLIMQAVSYGCRYSAHDSSKGAGYITTREARAMMDAAGAIEPDDRSAAIRAFSVPMANKQDNGSEHWPINGGSHCAEDQAWAMIHGIEDGWFAHDRAGFLQWTQLGRDRFAAGESASFVQASGQAAFAF
jgi:hypothetical protein